MNRHTLVFCFFCLLCSDMLLADALSMSTTPPRSYGYVIGDVIDQRILLDTATENIETIEQPETGRTGPWLERQSVTITSDKEDRLWLMMRYQIINSPAAIMQISLPAVVIALAGEQLENIPEHPISIAPLIPTATDQDQPFPAMQPDQAPRMASLENAGRRVKLIGLALATILLLWAIWWVVRFFSDRKRLPFAQALYQLKKMDNAQHDSDPQAWVTLHRAFNQVAGKTFSAKGLPELLAQQPWLIPHKESIESFFDSSSRRFFDDAQVRSSPDLLELTTGLYRAEKQQATRKLQP